MNAFAYADVCLHHLCPRCGETLIERTRRKVVIYLCRPCGIFYMPGHHG